MKQMRNMESIQTAYPALLTVRQKVDTTRKYQMSSRMEHFAMFMNLYKSWLLFSCNDSLRHVTCTARLRHQSASTKARSKKEAMKSERRGNNNKTDVQGNLSSTKTFKKGQQVKIHIGEVQQMPPCSHPLLLTLPVSVYKHQHTTRTQNY